LKDRTAAATELLELEGLSQVGPLTPAQNERWQALALEIFGPDLDVYIRRSFRLDAHAKSNVSIKRSEFACTLTQISHLGCALEGDVFRYIEKGEPLELRWVEGLGGKVELNLKCHVVWTEAQRTSAGSAGVLFSPDNAVESRRRFFDELYYPLYLAFLRKLCKASS
jgi:hypothetical protein